MISTTATVSTATATTYPPPRDDVEDLGSQELEDGDVNEVVVVQVDGEHHHKREASSRTASTCCCHSDSSTQTHEEGEEQQHVQNNPAPAMTVTMEEGPRFMEAMAPMMTAPVELHSSPAGEKGIQQQQPQPIDMELMMTLQASESSPPPTKATTSVSGFADPLDTKARLQRYSQERMRHHRDRMIQIYEQATASSSASSSTMARLSSSSSSISTTPQKNNTNRAFLLLSGPSGTGKRRLAESALREMVEQRDQGYYLQGHYDSLRRSVPYSGLVMAFSSFTTQVLERNRTAEMRKVIYSHLGACADVSVLIGMIPALQGILGCTECPEEMQKAKNAKNKDDPIQRFIFAFRMFIRAISQHQPLVLVMHDLHHADYCSLDMLAGVATDPHNNLLLIGTCDDSQLSRESYLASKLREIEDASIQIQHASLKPIQSETELQQWLTEALSFDRNDESQHRTAQRLTRLVHKHTRGNWFLVTELIQWMQESDLLVHHAPIGRWELATPEEIDVVLPRGRDFLVDKLDQQVSKQETTKQVIKVAACLGTTVDSGLVQLLLDFPVDPIFAELVERGLLLPSHSCCASSVSARRYVFQHDGIRRAAHRLIPEPDLFHLEIGRRLWRKLSLASCKEGALEEHLFVILSQMYVGRRLITREKERIAIATLCLHAGKKAALASTFRTAFIYLQMGLDLLTCRKHGDSSKNVDRCWKGDDQQYDLALALHCAAAEMTIPTARFDETNRLLEPVFEHARSFEDKLQAYTTKMCSLSQQDQNEACLKLGFDVLRQLGETFPMRLCMPRMVSEMRSVGKLLKNKSNEQILRMPHIADTKKLAALQVLNFMILPAINCRPKLSPFVFLKMTKITMLYGLSVFASSAFGTYGMLYIGATCDVEKGSRFGELALQLLEQFGVMEYLPRVYAVVYGCIHGWTKPIQTSLGPLLHAYRVGMQTGDAEYGGLCANLYCFYAMDMGANLDAVRREWMGFKETLISAKQTFLLRMFLPCMQTIHHFMGYTDDPLAAKGDLTDYDELIEEARAKDHRMCILSVKFCRCMLGVVFRDFALAEANTLTCQEIMETPPSFERFTCAFYLCLVTVEVAREGRNYRKNTKTAKAIVKWLKRFARNSPHNGLEKSYLIQAELASLQGEKCRAYEKYLTAIALSRENGHIFMHALSNELFGRHLLRLDQRRLSNHNEARVYLERAVQSYGEWGGTAKATRLQDELRLRFGTTNNKDPTAASAAAVVEIQSGLGGGRLRTLPGSSSLHSIP